MVGRSAKTGCRCSGFQVGTTRCRAPRREPQCFPVASELLRVDGNAREPEVGLTRPFGDRHEPDARRLAQSLSVTLVYTATSLHALVEALQLRVAERGEEVAEPVVEPDVEVLVVNDGLACLSGEMSGAVCKFLGTRHEHPTTARRDDLVPVEREDPNLPEGACRLPR